MDYGSNVEHARTPEKTDTVEMKPLANPILDEAEKGSEHTAATVESTSSSGESMNESPGGNVVGKEVDDSEDFTLYVFPEVKLYAKIAPMRSSGYYANEWNVNEWDWSGRLRVVAHGYKACTLYLEDEVSSAPPSHQLYIVDPTEST